MGTDTHVDTRTGAVIDPWKRLEKVERERDQQERFKWEANKRADKAESALALALRDAERGSAILKVALKYQGEYLNPSPDLMLRKKYRKELFALLDAALRDGQEGTKG